MNIKIKGTDIEVTQAINEYVNKKVGEALEKFNESENILSEVELSKTNNHHNHGEIYKISIKVSGPHINLFVDTKKDDLYAGIDELKDKLEYGINKIKNKKTSVSRKLALKFKSLFKGQ